MDEQSEEAASIQAFLGPTRERPDGSPKDSAVLAMQPSPKPQLGFGAFSNEPIVGEMVPNPLGWPSVRGLKDFL